MEKEKVTTNKTGYDAMIKEIKEFDTSSVNYKIDVVYSILEIITKYHNRGDI